jgi:DNA-binding protein Fis
MSLEEIVRAKLREYFQQTQDIDTKHLYSLILERVERPLIELTLEHTSGNQLQAAAILGINRNTLRKKITALKIDPRSASKGKSGANDGAPDDGGDNRQGNR